MSTSLFLSLSVTCLSVRSVCRRSYSPGGRFFAEIAASARPSFNQVPHCAMYVCMYVLRALTNLRSGSVRFDSVRFPVVRWFADQRGGFALNHLTFVLLSMLSTVPTAPVR